MHDTHGEIEIGERILAKNDAVAGRTREELRSSGVYSINLISSPGSGKTTIIEKTLAALAGKLRVAVIEGDIATELDSDRIRKCGVPVRQITTGRSCHLDARMISTTLPWVLEQCRNQYGDEGGLDLLIIENVGNMVCPAEYDLGEEMKVAVMSTTEGDDKPLKYPSIFHASSCLLLNKTDLLGHTDFDLGRAKENALRMNRDLDIFETSCTTGEGLGEWFAYIEAKCGAPLKTGA